MEFLVSRERLSCMATMQLNLVAKFLRCTLPRVSRGSARHIFLVCSRNDCHNQRTTALLSALISSDTTMTTNYMYCVTVDLSAINYDQVLNTHNLCASLLVHGISEEI